MENRRLIRVGALFGDLPSTMPPSSILGQFTNPLTGFFVQTM